MSNQPDGLARFRVHGRVQGVGFRWWTRRTAERLGLTGSVRNMPDGTVQIHARGPADAIRTFESRLQRGPPSARVRRVERLSAGSGGDVSPDAFRIEP